MQFGIPTAYAQPAFDSARDVLGETNAPSSIISAASLPDAIATVILALTSILGVIALILILNAGFHYMLNATNPEKIERAKKQMFWGVIGLAIILAANALAQFVVGALLVQTP